MSGHNEHLTLRDDKGRFTGRRPVVEPIAEQRAAGLSDELWVHDPHSQDGTADRCERFLRPVPDDVQVGAVTNVGKVRAHNEDFIGVNARGDVVLSDGMGGHGNGEMASEIGTAKAMRYIDEGHFTMQAAFEAVRLADHAVWGTEQLENDQERMGSTMVVVGRDTHDPTRFVGAWSGDSRAYLFNPKTGVEQLTNDHATPNGALTQCVGHGAEPDTFEVTPDDGDWIIVCSDGLTNEVDDDQMTAILRDTDNAADASHALTEAALKAGGRDNITVAVIDTRL